MADLTEQPDSVRLVHDPATIAACRADLARLLPQWLSLDPDERQWQLQRFLDRLTAQPELIPAFRAVLQQITQTEGLDSSDAGHELQRELLQSLQLL